MSFRRAILAVIAVLAIAAGALGSPAQAAPADPIDDKRAEAARIADRVQELGTEIELLAEDYNAATIRLAELNARIAEAERKLGLTRDELVLRRTQVRDYAIEAYVRGGDVATALPSMFNARTGTEAGRRAGYLAAASGDRQRLIDQLRVAEEDVTVDQDRLASQRADAEAAAAGIESQRRAAEAAVAEQEGLYEEAQGELADLVRQEEERRAAAERAAAEAAAAAAAARPTRPAPPTRPPPSDDPAPPGTPDPPDDPPPPPSDRAAVAVETAYAQLGDPYEWAGGGPDSFDCSGLTSYAWRAAGVSLPHNSAMQYSATRRIDASQLAPGDLVFYGFSSIHHVAIYVGNGQIIHAPHAGDVVRLDSVHYWSDLRGYGRVG